MLPTGSLLQHGRLVYCLGHAEASEAVPMKSKRHSPRPLIIAAGAYATLGGAVSFLGWAFHLPRLTDWLGSGIAIKANAALTLVVCGVATLMRVCVPKEKLTVRVLSAFAVAVGALTLLEHITGINLGIDTLLFDEAPGAVATAAPGRMGPPAALSLFCIGLALILTTARARAAPIAVGLGLAVTALGVLSITGYLFQAEAIYTIPRLTGIALQTASMLVALGVAVTTIDPERQPVKTFFEDSNAGALARRLLPLAFIIPLGLGWLRLAGQRAGLYDAAFGTALRSIVEVSILSTVVWWGLHVLRTRDLQQVAASRNLHDNEKRLLETLESITDAFVTLDPQWRFTFVNSAAEAVLRRPRGELVGYVLWDLFPQWMESPLRAAFLRAVREHVMIEVEAPDPLRGDHDFLHRIYPNPDGGFSVFFQDVTLRKRNEAALLEADRRKDEFLATLAHELRNPLGPLRNAAQILQRNDIEPAVQRSAAEIIGRQVRHMARLLDDLLDISRISRNRLELRCEQTELEPIIRNALEASRAAIDQAHHTLSVDLPENPVHVIADAVRLTQVFCNLLNNSSKYTPPGGCLELSAACQDARIVVRIKDNGIGIEPAMMPHVFDMFSQASAALPHSQGGLGIGLALARGVIELHGGSIEAASEGAGRGSVFTVTLPQVLASIEDAAKDVGAEASEIKPRSVLVVDDLRDGADSLTSLLRLLGHEVHTAYEGESALKLAGERKPDILLLDLGMPTMDGYELCRRIRATLWGRDRLIVAISGWGQVADRRRTAQAGFDHHLIKPVDIGALTRLFEQTSTIGTSRHLDQKEA